jgi:SCY1-like protein 1
MADTALPATEIVSTSNPASTRMGSSGDTSWAGWAISSFTNKITTARGEMQTSQNGLASVAHNDSKPTSLPASGRTTPATLLSSDKAGLVQTEEPSVVGKSSVLADQEAEDAFEAWGAVEDEDESFFDAPSSRKRSPSPTATTKYNDGGEPDFAGWLAAQSQAKTKRPLPKGLTQTSKTRSNLADRTTSTSSIGSGAGTKKLLNTTAKPKVTNPVRKVDTRPKETEATEDGWGDDWD